MISFIGAGPGDPELITVKGKRLIETADLILYAGSLVPEALVAQRKPGTGAIDSSGMTLEETHALMREADLAGKDVARVHTGDPALYGAVREQMALLDAEGIAYRVVPGVTAAFAAAAAARVSLTVPESVQSFSITRLGGRTDVPPGQSVRELARHGGSLAVYLSATYAARLEKELLAGGVDPRTPVLVAYRVGWPEERLVRAEVRTLAATVAAERLTRQTVFLILPGERDTGKDGSLQSRLYANDFSHGFRNGGTEEEDA
ncbi:MAG: precorrin-4 C(11)-methyltransferase [Deltaproteobacteria bacterium]|nr:precorrin-4 C(11)-methyltransferase [Deltaproteobacteria bacterium]